MSYLLDTHVWIWSQSHPNELGKRTAKCLLDPENELHVSTISTLEIARLVAAGTIGLTGDLSKWLRIALESLRCRTIEVSHEIAVGAYALPGAFHKDPADRIIASTARIHELTIVTADARILDYRHVKSMDARR